MQGTRKRRTGLLESVPLIVSLMLLPTVFGAAQTPEVPEAKLESVAKAYIQVVAIQEEYRPRIEAAQSPEEAQQMQQAANQEMVEVIDAEDGVTLEEYNSIIQATQNDDDLAARLNEHIRREIGG